MTRAFIQSFAEAGRSIESGKRAQAVEKLCSRCGVARIPKRKTYCGPCYDVRLQEIIAASRHKYAKPKTV